MAESIGNNAGELNVKFTANTAPLKEGAAEVKKELEAVGDEGQAAGEGVSSGMAGAAAAGIAAGAAIAKLIEKFNELAKEAREYDIQRTAAFGTQESHLASLQGRAAELTDYDRERSRINQELADTTAEISDKTAKYLDTHGSLLDGAARMLGVQKSVSEVIKDQVADMEAARAIREQEIQALNELTAKQAENSNRIKQAAQTGDSINVEKERARQEIEALERKRDSLSGAGSYAALGEVTESIRLRKLELDDAIKKIEAEREARAIRDMENASAQALAEARREMREKDREEREAQRDHEREMANLARERLRVEREITRERNQQQAGFGLGNVNFSSGRAMQAAIGQSDISQRWSD